MKQFMTALAGAAALVFFTGPAAAAGWTTPGSIQVIQMWKTGTWVQISDTTSNPHGCPSQFGGWYRLDADTASRPLLAKLLIAKEVASNVSFYADSCIDGFNAISAVSD